MGDWTDKKIQRRCINFSAFRLDGLADLLPRARDASILDIGCNRGAISYDLMLAGAKVCHGLDNYVEGIRSANEYFADIRSVDGRFEVCDLTGGGAAIQKAFKNNLLKEYDIVMMLAVYHKLHRVMPLEKLLELVDFLAGLCGRFFVWRGARGEKPEFEHILIKRGFKLVHYSEICEIMLPEFSLPVAQPAAIWAKTETENYKEK